MITAIPSMAELNTGKVVGVLHSSLLELSEAAPQCTNAANARGILAEAQDLVRNAVDHNDAPQELVVWFSQLVTTVLHSDGIRELADGSELILTGAVGREDALPSSPIKWITVHPDSASSAPVAQLLTDVGLDVIPTEFGYSSRPRQAWEELIAKPSASFLGILADAGSWVLEQLLQKNVGPDLLANALRRRPPRLSVRDGLPDRDVAVDIRQDLLYPIIATARWAGYQAGSTAISTPRRLAVAESAGVLGKDQAEYLGQAWAAGIQLQMQRWRDRIHQQHATAEALPPLQRSVFGAAARQVSDVLYSLEQEHHIPR